MANNGYIGRAPGDSSVIIARKTYEPTGIQTDFTFTAGYEVGYCDVYVNGVRLIASNDYTAQNGSTVGLTSYANSGDIVEIIAYKAFNIGSVDTATANFDIGGNLDVTGVTTGLSAYYTGVVTASSFSGDGGNLTNVGMDTGYINATSINVLGITTSVDLRVSGGSTFVGVSNFSAAINADATTDSTSTSTGALIVDGGVGIAKNVYIGAGLSVAGTLTYEDVTNVDSVGLITAKSGVNVSGGELTVGSGITMGIAGVATFSGTGDVHLLDNVRLNVGDGSDLAIYHNATNSAISISNGQLQINKGASENIAKFTPDGSVDLYYNNGKTFETTANGVTIYDDGKDDEARLIVQGGEGNAASLYLYADDGDDNADKWRMLSLADGALSIQNYASGSWETNIEANGDGNVELNYNNSKKFETTNDGTVTTGVSTSSLGFNLPDGGAAAGYASIDVGSSGDFQIWHHSNNHTYFVNNNSSGQLIIGSNETKIMNEAVNETCAVFNENGNVELYYDNSKKIETTNEGIEVTGFTSTTAGMGVTGGLFEGAFIKAGKLSDNLQIGIATANVFYFTTAETTTATPNIRWNDTYSLSSKMAVGDMASVTVITTAAAAGYAANWTIDGIAVTEEWVGGSAPSAGGADGLDIYSLTIIKTGTGTGDSGFKVIGNLSNAT